MKVLIKKAGLMKWYKEKIGEKLDVLDESIIVNNKNYYQYTDGLIIDVEDCFSKNEIRGKKINRVIN